MDQKDAKKWSNIRMISYLIKTKSNPLVNISRDLWYDWLFIRSK